MFLSFFVSYCNILHGVIPEKDYAFINRGVAGILPKRGGVQVQVQESAGP